MMSPQLEIPPCRVNFIWIFRQKENSMQVCTWSNWYYLDIPFYTLQGTVFFFCEQVYTVYIIMNTEKCYISINLSYIYLGFKFLPRPSRPHSLLKSVCFNELLCPPSVPFSMIEMNFHPYRDHLMSTLGMSHSWEHEFYSLFFILVKKPLWFELNKFSLKSVM